MHTRLLMLAAAGLLFAGSASASATRPVDSETQRYAERANIKAAALLAADGLDATAPPVSVRARVRPDGGLAGLEIVRTSGSARTDRLVAGVLRRILLSDAPVGLLDATVTLNVGQGATLMASAH
jgi:hypothetical protein